MSSVFEVIIVGAAAGAAGFAAGAAGAGATGAGAAWGFGGEEELINAKADYIVRVPGEICDIAMGLI